jgi:hypothetical protein
VPSRHDRERCSRRSSKSGKQFGVCSLQAVEQTLPAVNRVGGAVRWTDIIVDRVGYQDVSVRRGKLERNLALLELDHADMPDDAFTLFNLGWALMDLGRTQEALGGRSLEKSTPDSSIICKLFYPIAVVRRSSIVRTFPVSVLRARPPYGPRR